MIRFILENLIDESTLTASPENASGYPITNVSRVLRGDVSRSDDIPVAQEYVATWDDVQTANSFIIGRHNFSQYVTYQLILYDDENATGNIVYNSGTTKVTETEASTDYIQWGEFRWGIKPWDYNKKDDENIQFRNIVLWFDSTEFKSMKLIISGPASEVNYIYCNNEDVYCNDETLYCNDYGRTEALTIQLPYFEIGRLFLGTYIEPAFNISYGHTLDWRESTAQYRAGSGTLRSDITTKNKRFVFDLNTIPESDRQDIQFKLVRLGLTKDFFISMFPTDNDAEKIRDYSGIVKITKVPKYTEIACNYYKSNYVAEEV